MFNSKRFDCFQALEKVHVNKTALNDLLDIFNLACGQRFFPRPNKGRRFKGGTHAYKFGFYYLWKDFNLR